MNGGIDGLVERLGGFMGAGDDYSESSLVIVGAPMDLTVSFRPGTREGPRSIRQASYGLEEYSIDLDRDLREVVFCDAGDVPVLPGSVGESLRRIGRAAAEIMAGGRLPVFLGGEHLISLPVITEAARFYQDLAVVHLDAHADMRDEYLGERLSHATVMRRVAEIIGGENIFQFGIRSGCKEEIEFARRSGHLYCNQLLEPLAECLPVLEGRPVYVTLDIDVVDPAYAPGTGTAEPGGCSAAEIVKAVHLLGKLNVVGFDLVEVSPVYDPSQRTALLAAKIVREAVLSFKKGAAS